MPWSPPGAMRFCLFCSSASVRRCAFASAPKKANQAIEILKRKETAPFMNAPRKDAAAPPQQQPQSRSPQERRPSPAPPTTGGMSYSDDMAAFYDAWVCREEQILADLTAALALPLPPRRRSDALAPLVDAAVAHVAAYYDHKSRLADRDVVAALDPRWLYPLERTFLWAWGWKPALVFRFVETGGVGVGLGPEQRRALEELRAATAAAEREVDLQVAAVQESLAGPRVLAALRRQPQRNGEADEAVAAVGRSLRVLLAAADALRDRTLRGVIGMLEPDQAAAIVAAMLRFHIGVRRAGRHWGSGGRGAQRRV